MDPTWSKTLPMTERLVSERFELVWTRPLRQERDTNREQRDKSEPETVIFIPSTPRGELMKMMKESYYQFRQGSNIRQINL